MALHGTSTAQLDLERSSTFEGQWSSMGGVYLTVESSKARRYAYTAENRHGGSAIILEVEPTGELLPDEDWVLSLRSAVLEHGEGWELGEFVEDLKALRDGGSLVQTYREHFERLNAEHDVTWKDSVEYHGTFRQEGILKADQIERGWKVGSGDVLDQCFGSFPSANP